MNTPGFIFLGSAVRDVVTESSTVLSTNGSGSHVGELGTSDSVTVLVADSSHSVALLLLVREWAIIAASKSENSAVAEHLRLELIKDVRFWSFNS